MSKIRRRVLMFCYEYPPLGGGGADFIRDLLEEIEKRDVLQIDLITYGNTKFGDCKDIIGENVSVYRVAKQLPRKNRATTSMIGLLLYPVFAFIRALSLILKDEYDLVYSVFAVPSGVVGWLISRIIRKPHYLTVIGGDIYKPTKFYSPHRVPILKQTVRFIVNSASKVNTISNDVKKKLRSLFKVDRDVFVDNLGVPFSTIDTHKDTEKFDEFTFTSLARLDSRKGFDVLINAFSKLENDNVKLIIMGDGPERAKLDELVSSLGLEDRVSFLGFVDTEVKYKTLRGSDCFILSSHHEGFGLVYVEALRCGIPVLSTNCGGVADIVTEGENGLLTEVADIEGLAHNMQRMIDESSLYQKLKNNAFDSSKSFDISVAADRYISFLLD